MAALYTTAAKVLDKTLKKKGTLKSLVIESGFPNTKKLYAIACETLKYRQVIDKILETTKFQKLEKQAQLKYSLALVLVYECLFGQGLKCGGKFKQIMTRNKSSLNAALARMKIKAKVTSNEQLLPSTITRAALIPRYARVNLLLTSVEDVLQHFSDEGYQIQTCPESQQKGDKIIHVDHHIPDVMVFPPGTDLHNHELYNKGHIILQDKASCLPAHILNPPPGSHVIDACAAPGNKTSHLASHMDNKGKIFAFDTDNRRLTIMKKLIHIAGVECVTMKNMSFLKVDPNAKEYQSVEYIVVDPSCSGSGIVNRLDSLTDQPETDSLKQRLESLAQFQLSAVVHALSFPAVQKVVYSTCSIHQKENEDVVRQALDKFDGVFELSPIMERWTNRGLPVFHGAEKCIRASPEANKTNGFFVALLTRKNADTTSRSPHVCKNSDVVSNDYKNNHFLNVTETGTIPTLKRMNEWEPKTGKKKKRKKNGLLKNTDTNSNINQATTELVNSNLNQQGKKKKKRKKKMKSVVLNI